MANIKFIISDHALEQFRERCSPNLPFQLAKKRLFQALYEGHSIKEKSLLGSDLWQLSGYVQKAVVRRDNGTTVCVTVLPENKELSDDFFEEELESVSFNLKETEKAFEQFLIEENKSNYQKESIIAAIELKMVLLDKLRKPVPIIYVALLQWAKQQAKQNYVEKVNNIEKELRLQKKLGIKKHLKIIFHLKNQLEKIKEIFKELTPILLECSDIPKIKLIIEKIMDVTSEPIYTKNHTKQKLIEEIYKYE